MFNFKEAFSYLFKEKKWGLKFGIVYALNALIVIPSGLSSLITRANLPTTYTLNKLNTTYNYSSNNPATTASVLFLCFMLLILIPFMVVSLWYVYENVQAAIQNRQTKGIWEVNFSDTLKKAGKYFVVSFVYGLIFALIGLAIFGIIAGVFCVGTLLISGSYSNSHNLSTTGSLFGVLGIGSIALVCCLSLIIIVLAFVAYLFITPALLRLIGTNTLNEGLRFGDNWKIGKKYAGPLIALFLFNLAYGIIIGLLSSSTSLVTLPLYLSLPAVGIIFEIITQMILALLTTYFAYYVYPRLLGQLYRSVVKREEDLKYIDIGSD